MGIVPPQETYTMSTWIDPETHIEHNAAKRAADMEQEKGFVQTAYTKMRMTQDTLNGYKSIYDGSATLDEKKMASYEEAAKRAADVYESVLACCTTRAARTDFINAALAAGKTDREIYLMLLPAVECRTYYETTAIFKALVVALGGTITDISA
jgi:hypothetical protein